MAYCSIICIKPLLHNFRKDFLSHFSFKNLEGEPCVCLYTSLVLVAISVFTSVRDEGYIFMERAVAKLSGLKLRNCGDRSIIKIIKRIGAVNSVIKRVCFCVIVSHLFINIASNCFIVDFSGASPSGTVSIVSKKNHEIKFIIILKTIRIQLSLLLAIIVSSDSTLVTKSPFSANTLSTPVDIAKCSSFILLLK